MKNLKLKKVKRFNQTHLSLDPLIDSHCLCGLDITPDETDNEDIEFDVDSKIDCEICLLLIKKIKEIKL